MMTGSEPLEEVTLPARRLPPADVVVVGGGSAGIAAAVAAARSGVRTAIVERYGFLGGTSTAGLVGPFMTSYSCDGSQRVVAGIFQEVVERMAALGGAVDPAETPASSKWSGFIELGHAHVTPTNPEILKLVTMELVSGAGTRLLLHTSFVAARASGARVTELVLHDRAGLAVLPAQVVVDCTGDGDVAVGAGAPYTMGRDDGLMMPATMFFRVGNVDDARLEAWVVEHRRIHPGERLFECVVAAARARGEFPDIPRDFLNLYREPEPGEWRANISRLPGIDGTNPDHLTRAEQEGRRQVMALMRFMRAYGPGLERARVLEVAAQVGIRETRHVLGEYVLTGADVRGGARFPDAIARCGYPIDVHDPAGGRRGVLEGVADGGYYEIPYRSLVPRGLDNVLVAGRCIGADHLAAASARVIPPCYATGQAAGTAASVAVSRRCSGRDVDTALLRRMLRTQGALV